VEITVRRAGAEDAPALARLRWRWRIEERGEQHDSRDQFVHYFATWVMDNLATHLPFVVEADGRVVGMAFLALLNRVPTPGRLDRRGADIQSVYVVPEFRDAGVGTVLLAALRQEARNRELEIVTVHSSERAVSLYQRGGFEGSPRRLHWQVSDEDPSRPTERAV